MSPAFHAAKTARITSTFSCDIARSIPQVGTVDQHRAPANCLM
jgi:hypothetical protein